MATSFTGNPSGSGDRLRSGESLTEGKWVGSTSKRYRLGVLNGDCVLLDATNNKILWTTAVVAGAKGKVATVKMLSTGAFACYAANGPRLWESGAAGPNSSLEPRDDANAVICDVQGVAKWDVFKGPATKAAKSRYAPPSAAGMAQMQANAALATKVSAAAAAKKVWTDRMVAGQYLAEHQYIESPNKVCRLQLEKGALQVTKNGTVIWGGWGNAARPVARAVMQADGNFCCYDAKNAVIAASDTAGLAANGYLQIKDDGQCLVFAPNNDPKWDTVHGTATKSLGEKIVDAGKSAVNTVSSTLQTVAKPLTNNIIWTAAQTAASFIPGVGTAVSTAMSVTAAVGRGESAANIALAAARGACPGGEIVQAAFDIGVGVAKGERLDHAALIAARNQVQDMAGPMGAAAFDTAMALTAGQNAPAAALEQAHAAIVERTGSAGAAVAPVVAAFNSTRNAAVLVQDLAAQKPEAAQAVVTLKASAAAGNAKATTALAQLNAVAAARKAMPKAVAVAAVVHPVPAPPPPAPPPPRPQAAPAAAAAPARPALALVPSPPATAAPSATAPATAPAKGILAKVRAISAGQKANYVRGTSLLRMGPPQATRKRWHGLIATAV